jgi:ankyrin repeat protein
MDDRLPKDIKAALKALPSGSSAYRVAYEDAMKRVEHQGPKSTKFAKTILSWMVCAKRQLTLPELRHALAFEVGDPQLDLENLPLPQDIVSVCAGLVTIDPGSGIISMVHYTTQEYFERTRNQWFPTADYDMARACATYLSFEIFQTGPCPTDTEFEERLRIYQLYDYAARFWGHHAREAASQDRSILEFLQSQAKAEASSQALLGIKEYGGPWSTSDVPARMTGLHLAAYFGVEKVVSALVGKYGRDPEDGHKRTPLSWAAQNGQEAVVRLLLAVDANKASSDKSGMTPLSWATRGNHEAIVQLLLGNDDIDAEAAGNSDVLQPSPEAVERAPVPPPIDEGVCLEPVDNQDKTLGGPCPRVCCIRDTPDSNGQTALHRAAAEGDEAMIKTLLRPLVEDMMDNAGRTPLAVALHNGHEGAARLLLGRSWEVADELLSELAASKLSDLERRLFKAASTGDVDTARLLIRLGVDLEAKGHGAYPQWGGTALLEAIVHGQEQMVRLLIESGASKTTRDDYSSRTPLQWAEFYDMEEIIPDLS